MVYVRVGAVRYVIPVCDYFINAYKYRELAKFGENHTQDCHVHVLYVYISLHLLSKRAEDNEQQFNLHRYW